MKTLIKISLQRPITVIMLFIGIMFTGILSAILLPRDFVPEIEIPKLVVSTVYRSASPEDIRTLVTIPLEDGLSSISGLKSMNSVSRSGISTIELEFHWGTDILMAGVNAREIIDRQYSSLPDEVKKPVVLSIDPNQKPIMIIGVFPKRTNLSSIRRLAEREIKTEFQQVNGVGSALIVGAMENEIQINIDQNKLNSRGMNIIQLSSIIGKSNINYPAGTFKEGSKEYLLKSKGEAESIFELGRILINSPSSEQQFSLDDISEIRFAEKEQVSFFQSNGDEGIAIYIRRRSKENPVSVAAAIRKKVDELSRAYGNDLEFRVLHDESITITKSINSLFLSLALGSIIAFFVLLFFTRNLRISFILIFSIPFSIFITLTLMKLTGLTLNVMSLGGLALGIGMLVDNSVGVLENLDKRLKLLPNPTISNYLEYTYEMASSTMGSTLTSIIVFVPILFLPGIIGALYRDLALTVSFALASSFLVSITLLPVIYRLTFKPGNTTIFKEKITKSERVYRKLLKFFLRKPLFVLLLLIATILPIPVLIKYVPFEFMPELDEGRITIEITTPPGTNISWIKEVSSSISEKLLGNENVDYVYSRAGAEIGDTYFLSDPDETSEILHMDVRLKKGRSVSTFDLVNYLQDNIQIFNSRVSIGIPDSIVLDLLGVTSNSVALKISMEKPEDIIQIENEILAPAIKTDYFYNIQLKPSGKTPEIHILPYRENLLRTGATLYDIGQLIHNSVEGAQATRMTLEGEEYDIKILVRKEDINSLDKLSELQYTSSQGQSIALNELVELKTAEKQASLVRTNRKDSAFIYFEPAKDTYNQATQYIKNLVKDNSNISSVGETVFEENISSIILIFSISIILLYLFLGAQFESFFEPLVLLTTLPMSISGVIIALFIGGSSINLNSVLGILVLFGIVVNNSIVLRDQMKRISAGKPFFGRYVYESSIDRLRPILITTTTTVAALLPIAFQVFGENSQSSLSIAVIGGLILSTILTLFVIPVISVRKN